MNPRQLHWGFLVAAFLSVVPGLGAQTGTVTGRVTDQATGQQLSTAQVSITGTSIGGLSQQDGRFLILNVPAGSYTIMVQRIGYRPVTAEITVVAGETVAQNFTMSQEALGLDEIIITGTPGGTQRRAIGNSVVSMDAASVVEAAQIPNMNAMLQGRNPGVMMGSAGGAIGVGADISIRGYGSFSRDRAQPLVYVDGVRVNNEAGAGPQLEGGRGGNVLNDFNPADIESIEIIKGPAAATLYGTEASAGVIQIITKKGAQGSPQFTASIAEGRNFMARPQNRLGWWWGCKDLPRVPCPDDQVVPYSYMHNMNTALRDGTLNPEWNYDRWPQSNVLQYGPSRSYNLAVRGGTERIRYFLSANNDYNEGGVYYNYDEATRLRANVGVIMSDAFSLDVSTGFVMGETSYEGQVGTRGGLFDQMVWGNGYCTPYVADKFNPCPRVLGMQQMIPTDIAKISSTRNFDRFTGSATLNYNPGGWLASRVVVGIDQGWDRNEWIHPIETVQANVIQETRDGKVVFETPSNSEFTFDWSTTGTFRFGDSWSTATSVGAQFYGRSEEMFSAIGEGFVSPLSRTVNQTPITRSRITYDYVENKSLGFYLQEQVGWNDRVFLTAAVRFDDNSAFGSDFDPILYPKFSGTWVVSEESFWNFDFVESLRLRSAWGKAGQQPSTFAAVNTFAAVAGPGGTSALDPTSTGNPIVGPEVSTELEIGMDVSVLSGRVSGEFNWYNTRSRENLLGIALAPSRGQAGTIQSNVGVIDKWGWEASLITSIYESPTLRFGIDLNGAYTMNEVKELGEFPGSSTIKIGWTYPLHGQFGTQERQKVVRAEYDPNGNIVDPRGRRIQAYCDAGVYLGPDDAAVRTQYGTNAGGAEVRCQDLTGNEITPGIAYAPYNFSITPTLSLRGGIVNMHAKFDGAYGRTGNDRMSLWHDRYNTSYGSVTQNDPVYSAAYRINQFAQRAYFEGDFWKLREVGVRYELPEVVAGLIGAQRASLGFSGRELAIVWWKDNGELGLGPVSSKAMNHPATTALDPEFGRGQLGDGGHRTWPPSSSFHLRFDVTF